VDSSIEIVAAPGGQLNKYDLPDLLRRQEDDEVLIPQLLPVSEPSFAFEEQGALRLTLHYEDFFLLSIMPRFIVKRHQEIKDKLRWRTGVVLAHPLLDATASAEHSCAPCPGACSA
jgi:hypothetical protein